MAGILSDDGTTCCLEACGQCGGSGCGDVEGTCEKRWDGFWLGAAWLFALASLAVSPLVRHQFCWALLSLSPPTPPSLSIFPPLSLDTHALGVIQYSPVEGARRVVGRYLGRGRDGKG